MRIESDSTAHLTRSSGILLPYKIRSLAQFTWLQRILSERWLQIPCSQLAS